MSDYRTKRQFDKDYLGEFPPLDEYEKQATIFVSYVLKKQPSGWTKIIIPKIADWLKEHDQQTRDEVIEEVAKHWDEKDHADEWVVAEELRNMKGGSQ